MRVQLRTLYVAVGHNGSFRSHRQRKYVVYQMLGIDKCSETDEKTFR